MTVSTSSLTWSDTAQADAPVAAYTVDFASDNTWLFALNGSYQGSSILPIGANVDNSNGDADITVSIGALIVTVNPFTRANVTLPAGTQSVSFDSPSAKKVKITFYRDASVFANIAGINQYAIQSEVDTAITSNSIGAMSQIINPSLAVWPDGTTFPMSLTAGYTAEGWMQVVDTAGFYTVSKGADPFGRGGYGIKLQRTPAAASAFAPQLGFALQSADSAQFVGGFATISFDLSFGAGMNGQGNLVATIVSGTGNDEPVLPGFTNQTVIGTASIPYSPGAQRVSVTTTAAIAAGANQLGFLLTYAGVGAASGTEYFVVSNAQIDFGKLPQGFRPVPEAFERERCKYYYERLNYDPGMSGTDPYAFCVGIDRTGTAFADFCLQYSRKRVNPVVTLQGTINVNFGPSLGPAVTAVTASFAGTTACFISVNKTQVHSGQPVILVSAGNAGQITINARM